MLVSFAEGSYQFGWETLIGRLGRDDAAQKKGRSEHHVIQSIIQLENSVGSVVLFPLLLNHLNIIYQHTLEHIEAFLCPFSAFSAGVVRLSNHIVDFL